jgi:DNA-binding CsgD family transcriptional regulator
MPANLIDDTLIDAMYGDAVQGGNWTPAMIRFCTLLRATETTVSDVVLDPRPLKWRGGIAAATGSTFTADARDRYSSHYLALDPKTPIFACRPSGFLFNDMRHFDERFVARSPFYQEFSRSIGTRHTLDMLVHRDHGREIYLAAMRSKRQGSFDIADERLIVAVSRHFLRAWKLRELVSEAQTAARTAAAALDRLNYGIAVLDEAARLVFANAFALAALMDGSTLRIENGRLSARCANVQRALDAAVARAATGRGAAHAIRVPRAERQCWLLWCLPLSPTSSLAVQELPGILIVVRDPALRSEISGRDLMALFELTLSEAEVAKALAEGQTLSAIAERRGVKPSTVHTQLHRILQKTGLHRQSDLVRTIVSLSAVQVQRSN